MAKKDKHEQQVITRMSHAYIAVNSETLNFSFLETEQNC